MLQHLKVFIELRDSETNSGFKTSSKSRGVITGPAGLTIVGTNQDALALLGHLGTLLAGDSSGWTVPGATTSNNWYIKRVCVQTSHLQSCQLYKVDCCAHSEPCKLFWLLSWWMRHKSWLTEAGGLDGREEEKLLAVTSCNNTPQLCAQFSVRWWQKAAPAPVYCIDNLWCDSHEFHSLIQFFFLTACLFVGFVPLWRVVEARQCRGWGDGVIRAGPLHCFRGDGNGQT